MSKSKEELLQAHNEIKRITLIANKNAKSCDALAQEIDRQREQLSTLKDDMKAQEFVIDANFKKYVSAIDSKDIELKTIKDRLARASVAFQEIKTEVKDCLTPSNLIAIEVDRIASEYLKSLEVSNE
jgi:hypothetical protein